MCQKSLYFQTATGQCSPCPSGGDCSLVDDVMIEKVSGKPGFWHSQSQSSIFSDCKKAYMGVSAVTMAEERCCPLDPKTNVSICMNLNLTNDNLGAQCKEGYTGYMCKICAKDYVPRNGNCDKCLGGGDIMMGAIALLAFCVPVILLVIVILMCMKADFDINDQEDKADSYIGQIKILIAFLQIMSSMPAVMDGVPWPKAWLNVAGPFSAINLDLIGLSTFVSCKLALLFPGKFVLHMCLPILFILAVVVAYGISRCVKKTKSAVDATAREAIVFKIVIVGILFLYPGLATKVFSMVRISTPMKGCFRGFFFSSILFFFTCQFRCKSYNGVPENLLEVDFTVVCFSNYHMSYVIIGAACGLLYVLGIPIMMWVVLWK